MDIRYTSSNFGLWGPVRRRALLKLPVGGALTAGTASILSKTATTVSLSASSASGGTSPYTYQWQRSTAGGAYTNIVGATALTYTDNGRTSGTLYAYKIVYTDAVPASVTSAATATIRTWIDPNNSSMVFSPGNWYSDGGGAMAANNITANSASAKANNPGAYLKFKVQIVAGAGLVKLELDCSTYNYSGATASKMPTLSWAKDADAMQTQLLAYSGSTVEVTLATGLTAGTYLFQVWFKSIDLTTDANGARWSSPNLIVKTYGIDIDNDAVMSAPPTNSRKVLVFGDSLSEGAAVVSAGTANANNDSTLAAYLWGVALQAEVGVVAFGGQGFVKGIGSVTASATNPSLENATPANESYDEYFAGASRLVAGAFNTSYDVIIVEQGTNDTSLTAASVTALVDKLRTAAGTATWIFVVSIPSGTNGNTAALATGVANAASTAKSKYIATTILFTPAAAYTPRFAGEAFSAHLSARGYAHWIPETTYLMATQMAGGGSGAILARIQTGM